MGTMIPQMLSSRRKPGSSALFELDSGVRQNDDIKEAPR
jgi:hypothetical protein